MIYTTNYSLRKPAYTDKADIVDLNYNADTIDAKLKEYSNSFADLLYPVAGGTATAITLNLPTLTNGYAKTFIANANNSGAATTINSKPLYKPGTTIAPTLISGKAYTVWYNSTSLCFFIKASAEGNAIVGQVLAGYTFSNDNDTGLTGTMANKGAVNQVLGINGSFTIPAGYHNGSGVVSQNISTKAAATITPNTSDQVISAGQYLSGAQTILGDPDLIASNIISGASIFGVTGSATIQSLGGTNYAKGSYYRSSSYFTISGLNFSPNFIYSISSSHYYIYDGSCRFFPSAVVLSFTYSTAGGSISGYVYTATTNYFTINSDGFYWKCTGGSGDTVSWSAAVL